MIALDMLFCNENEAKLNSEYFEDMGLACLKNMLTEKEYHAFAETIRHPLTEKEKIQERQLILQDFLKYPALLPSLQNVCLKAQNNVLVTHDRVYGNVKPKRKLAGHLQAINKSLEVPLELLDVLQEKAFASHTLSEMYKNLNKPDLLKEIKRKINEIGEWLLSDGMTLDVQYSFGFKLQKARVAAQGTRSATHKLRLGKSKQAPHRANEFAYNLDFILHMQVGDLMERGVKNMCSVVSHIHSCIVSLCKTLSRQLLFYSAAVKIVRFGKQIGCSVVFPPFESKTIQAKSLFDFGLLAVDSSRKGKVPNEFYEEKDAFYLISGANQGGKTTFLKSIGIAQLFAQNGLPVFADHYDGPVYQNLVTHFPKDEDATLSHGKLAEELTRFRTLLPLIKEGALVFMNESFATTTEREGCEIASDVLKALSTVRPSLFFVTHNFKLLKNRREMEQTFANRVCLRSLITSAGKSLTERTYSIVSGEPQEEIHGLQYVMKDK